MGGALVMLLAAFFNDSSLTRDLLHSNVFILGHESMEIVASCPFEDESLCSQFEAECNNKISQGTHIDEEVIAECAKSVEEAMLEVCGAMGGDCAVMRK